MVQILLRSLGFAIQAFRTRHFILSIRMPPPLATLHQAHSRRIFEPHAIFTTSLSESLALPKRLGIDPYARFRYTDINTAQPDQFTESFTGDQE